ncbi:MAG: hypothetical protein GT598_10550 [Bacteroidales bacterium]|nr:hypothetical protein [Bacteroidales bacterium]HPM18596.1 hypothetical protein [Bacteroidales bacterium]HQG76315.1 hypothetical protein [Bacteroidales bacterium]
MTGKSLKYLSVIVILIAVFLFLFRDRDPFGRKNSSFASKPKEEITRIELSDKSSSISLTRKDNIWMLNGSHEVRKSSISFLIQVVSAMEIKSPVSPELFRAEIREKGIEPVKVSVFGKRKRLNSFLVYKTQSNIYGNIMKKREGAKPFIVYLPGYETNIGSIFTVNELYWKPFMVFNQLPSDIASVNFENMTDTASSFSIQKEGGRFILSDKGRELSGWDTSRVIRYISYFAYIPFESWELEIDPAEQKTITDSGPLCIISLVTTAGENIRLTLWERFLNDGREKIKDTDRLWAKTDSNTALFIIRYMDIDPLLKKRSYFYP